MIRQKYRKTLLTHFDAVSESDKQPSVQSDAMDVPPNKEALSAPMPVNGWGWVPALSVTSAIGVFLVALAYEAGRMVLSWADALLWCGVLMLFLPIAYRLLSTLPARRERLALVMLLAMGLYLSKFLQYPLYFSYHDEFTHWRSAMDIAASNHLFQKNPLLPISAFYPGLEIVVNALSSVTGLSYFMTGIIVIGVARWICVLALYLFFERISASARIGAVSALLYMANPQFLFFQASFAYESLALPLAVFVLFVLAIQYAAPTGYRRGLTLLTWGGLAAVVVTHHISSYTLVAFLLLWSAIALLQSWRKKGQAQQSHAYPGREALFGLLLCFCWLTYTGDIVLGYLAPHLGGTLYQIGQIVRGESASRQLFQSSSGYIEPLWERIVAFASTLLIMLVLPFGLFQIWLRYRRNLAALALSAGALAYPVSQALRLTAAGAESGVRSTEFLFLGVAFVLALGIVQLQFFRASGRKRSLLLLCALAVVIVGQVVSGSSPAWARIPGPYLVSADQRSIGPEGISAAQWAGTYLGSGRRIASDRINTLLLATYGDEVTFTSVSEKVPVRPLFISPEFGVVEQTILQQDQIQFLEVDQRLSTAPPWVGSYFDEQAADVRPIDPTALTKFDAVNTISRLFDSGAIVIYDVEAITGLHTWYNRGI